MVFILTIMVGQTLCTYKGIVDHNQEPIQDVFDTALLHDSYQLA